MDTQPKIPTLKDSQKPQVKIRGLEAGVTLFDRLKQFKKKDLAFILAGLGTLFMAPLAEHFMMSPESADGQLQQGWGGKGADGRGMFDGSGSSPYEPGTTGLAPGSAIGGGSDIITPLNVRDPSALVMGPGATQQPPTSSVMPATPPPTAVGTRSDSDLKDALAASGRGVNAAARAVKSLLPVPKIALSGSGGLRGLGVVSGGSSAVGGTPITSNGLVSGRAANTGGLGGVHALPGYKGVARSGTGGGSGGMDALKAAAGNAGDSFNSKGAYQGATDAANTAIPTGGAALGGGGAGAVGATDKPFGGDQNHDGKNVGESLAFLKQKAMQEAQIALWSKEQEAGDNKLEALKIRNTMAETFTSKLAGTAADAMGCAFNNSGSSCPGPAAGGYMACLPNGQTAYQVYPASPSTCKGDTKGGSVTSGYVLQPGGVLATCSNGSVGSQVATNCGPASNGQTPDSGTSDPAHPNVDGLQAGAAGASKGDLAALGGLKDACKAIQENIKQGTSVEWLTKLRDEARSVADVRDAIMNGAPQGDCGTSPADLKLENSVISLEKDAMGSISGAQGATSGVLPLSKKAATAVDPKAVPDTADMEKKVKAAADALNQVKSKYCGAGPDCANTNILYTTDPIPVTANGVAGVGGSGSPADLAKPQMYLNRIKTAHAAVDKMLNNMVKVQNGIESAEKDSLAIAGKTDGTLTGVISVNQNYKQLKDQATAAPYSLTPPAPAKDGAPPANSQDAAGTTKAIKAAYTALGTTGDQSGPNSDCLAASLDVYKQQVDATNPPATADAIKQAKDKAQTALGNADRAVSAMVTTQTGWIDQTNAQLTSNSNYIDDASAQATAAK